MSENEDNNIEDVQDEEVMQDSLDRQSDAGRSGAGQSSSQDLFVQLEKENKENYDKYLRAIAELENFKKRATKERSELLKYAGENIIVDLLEVLDDLDRVTLLDASKISSPDEVIEGVRMIRGRFAGVFKKHSVEARDASGEKFDPLCHEALTTVPTKELPAGTVIEQLRKAYYLKDKLIRTAQVVVSAAIADS